MKRDLLLRSLVMTLALVLGISLITRAQFATPKTYTAPKLDVTVDGSADEWEGVPADELPFFSSGEDQNTGPDDHSVSMQVAYNDEFFFICITVKDDVLMTFDPDITGDRWKFDNMEIFFNPDSEHNDEGAYGDDASQMRMNYGLDADYFSGGGFWGGDADHTGFEYVSTDTGDGYILEGQIPWVGILPEEITLETILANGLGYDITVGDDDEGGARKAILAWANDTGADNSWKDTRCNGTLMLGDAIGGDGGDGGDGGETIPTPDFAGNCDGDGCATFKMMEFMKAAIEVDGDEGDWEEIPAQDAVFWTSGEDQNTGPDDFSVSFKTAYDDEFMYIIINVKDDVLMMFDEDVATDKWKFDNVEIFVNPDNEHNDAGAYGDDAMQMRMNYGVDDNLWSGNGWKLGDDFSGWEYVTTETGDGYFIEGKIALAGVFGDIEIGPGYVFGFDITIGDDDEGGARKSILAWANDTGADNSWKDTRCNGFGWFGNAVADPTDPSAVQDVEAAGYKVYPNPVANVINIEGAAGQKAQLMNLMGMTIADFEINSAKMQFDVSGIASGVYLLKVGKAIMKVSVQ